MSKAKKINLAFLALYAIAMLYFSIVCIKAGFIPGLYLGIIIATELLLFLLLWVLLLKKNKGEGRSVFGKILAVILSALLIVAGIYIMQADSVISNISDDDSVVKYAVVARDYDGFTDQTALNGGTVYITPETDSEYLNAQKTLTENLEAEDITFEYDYSDDNITLLEMVKIQLHDFAFIRTEEYNILCEQDERLEKKTKIIYEVEVPVEDEDSLKAVDVTKDVFSIYITGLDTTGSIDTVSRSDVNMIATVNPKKRQILLTSIPRDYYVKLHTAQEMDKLTHSGIYGPIETVKTVEDLLDIDINYYFKCNFSTVTSLIDAIGGVDVESEYEFTSGDYSFTRGTNHLTGETALVFARERHAFDDGDRQRIRNQQLVVEGTINKLTSSETILTNYSDILKAIKPYMQTSLTNKDIKKLVKMQLSDMSGWEIKRISIDGDGGMDECYAAGNQTLYVMYPNEDTIDGAKKIIASVYRGDME